jgi:hypothetical protein
VPREHFSEALRATSWEPIGDRSELVHWTWDALASRLLEYYDASYHPSNRTRRSAPVR